jgi:hypothetical protein
MGPKPTVRGIFRKPHALAAKLSTPQSRPHRYPWKSAKGLRMTANDNSQSWRFRLVIEVSGYFLIKLCLLTLLWGLFFSSSHRCRVDGIATANRLALTALDTAVRVGDGNSGEDLCD